MAREFRTRPSALLGVADSYHAFSLDRAVWVFGSAVEAGMDDAEKHLPKKASESMRALTRQRTWDSYMGIDTAKTPGRFADPAKSKQRR